MQRGEYCRGERVVVVVDKEENMRLYSFDMIKDKTSGPFILGMRWSVVTLLEYPIRDYAK